MNQPQKIQLRLAGALFREQSAMTFCLMELPIELQEHPGPLKDFRQGKAIPIRSGQTTQMVPVPIVRLKQCLRYRMHREGREMSVPGPLQNQ